MGGAGGLLTGMLGLVSAGTQSEAAQAKARAEQMGDLFQAKQEKEMYFQGMTKSWQTETAMNQHLTSTLSNIAAIRGSSGADISSPSGEAIEDRTFGLGSQDIARTTQNIRQEAQKHLEASQFYMSAASDAIAAGNIASEGALLGGLGGLLKGFGGLFGG